MNIYVAGSRHERDTVNDIQRALVGRGHRITYDWTTEGNVQASHADGHEGVALDFWRDIADRELAAVEAADIIVAVMSPKGRGRGMFIEIGAALGQGTPVFLVGDAKVNDSNFWACDLVTLCKTPADLLWILKHLEAK